MLFENLEIIKPIQKALKEEGYKKTPPIQEQSIPYILDGKDLVGCAQTGTGKTAAFAVPVLQNLSKDKKVNKNPRTIRALVLAPTRELAIQIGESFECYGKYINLKSAVIFGGVSQNPQTKALREGVDILIATPGRMLDLFNQKYIDLRNIECFVLDEADRMLDMGMIHDVKKIISKLPKVRQNLLFSATMPSEITKLVDSIVKDPIRVEVTPVSSTVDTITQEVYHVRKKQKRSLLKHLLKDESIDSALVFSTTKRGANMIAKDLVEAGIEAEAIHGNKSQNARQRALNNFKEGNIRVLVATDIAARGIDVNELSHVFNYNLPDVPETYVHRIGRTGRAGAKGVAISFCDIEETKSLKAIEKLIHKEIPVVEEHPYKIRHINEDEVKEENTNNNSNKKPSSKRQGGNWRYSNNRRKNNSTKQIKK